jgi:hypothetical protein
MVVSSLVFVTDLMQKYTAAMTGLKAYCEDGSSIFLLNVDSLLSDCMMK